MISWDWQTGERERNHLFGHIQRRNGSSSENHPSWAQTGRLVETKGRGYFQVAFHLADHAYSEHHIQLPSPSRHNIFFPRARLLQSVSSLLSETQSHLEDVKKMVLPPPRNRSTKAWWPLSAHCRGSTKSSVDISKLSKCKWHIKHSMLC